MHKFGVALSWLSVVTCAVGLILGFREMIIYGTDNEWLHLVPIAFLGLFTGLVITLFSKP